MQAGKVRFLGDLPTQDSITICYQVLPTNLAQWANKRDMRLIDTTDRYWRDVLKKIERYKPPREQFIELKDFQKNGSFVRGLSLGNAQNVFVNSALNLQLEGKISDDLALSMSISDQQIPYQPEGNTLQLQQIDRVFMRLTHKNGSLTGGDIVLQNRDNHFLKFYKNTQGGLLETNYKVGKTDAKTFAGIASARGKFYSATIAPSEGVQGPYRLKGPNGELFIIILANSERVFIDGKPLQRGFNYDYVIDYNLGEVTFNNHILITRFTRIRIDFEYAEANYNRTILMLGHEQVAKKWRVLTQIYREADSKSNLIIDLSDSAKIELSRQTAGIGLINGIELKGYAPNEVRYKMIDSTTLAGTFSQVLVYSTDERKAVYRAFFTQVGKQKGDYIRENTNLNGQVYRWVQPINGIKQGDYAPLKTVPLPNARQLLVTQATYQISENERITTDIAFSSQQNNRFSDLPAASLSGLGTRFGYQNTGKIWQDSARYTWFGGAFYEYNQANFTPIDRFRSIEFDRDWSKNIDSSRLADHILQTEIGLKNQKNSLISYKFNTRNRGNQVNGWQQIGELKHETKRLLLQANAFFLKSDQDTLQSAWQRWQASLAYKTRYFIPTYRWEGDQNAVSVLKNDSVLQSAMHFTGHTFGIKSIDKARIKYDISYNIRQDQAPLEGRLQNYLQAETWTFSTFHESLKKRTLSLTAVYRKAILNEKFAQNNRGGENLQGRLDWGGEYKIRRRTKGGKAEGQKETTPQPSTPQPFLILNTNLNLTTSTGQELQREYYFIPVPVGQGTHAWRDDNGNEAQELNEFYIALNPDERQYAKIFRPTSNYISAYTQTLNYNLKWIIPPQKSKKSVGDFSGLLIWTATRRFTENNILARLLPLVTLSDTSILAEQSSLRKTVFFNRNSLNYGGELTYLNSKQKQLLTNGFEARQRQELKLSWRNSLSAKWNFQTNGTLAQVVNNSDFLQNRNFEVQSFSLFPELTYQANTTQRIKFGYQFSQKVGKNVGESALPTQVHQVSLEGQYSKLSRRTITFNGRFLQISYTGEQNTPLAYELLEALRTGSNFTWNMNWQERLQNGLQISFIYEGRKSPNTQLIHIGRAQVGLLF